MLTRRYIFVHSCEDGTLKRIILYHFCTKPSRLLSILRSSIALKM